MLWVGVDAIADDLRRYGEDAAADWIVSCSQDELVKVCSVAEWLLYRGPTLPSGASMMIAKACAPAAVYVREGGPRDLARSRRGPATRSTISGQHGRRPDPLLQKSAPLYHGVGDDARRFWATQ